MLYRTLGPCALKRSPHIKCVKQTNAGPNVETNEGVARTHPFGKHFISEVLTKATKLSEAFFLTSNIPSPGLEYCNVDNCVFKVFACLCVVRIYLQR